METFCKVVFGEILDGKIVWCYHSPSPMSCSASICCPIELEPRTLNQGQISHAREAAADVVEKMERTVATTIFTEGLKPVRTSKEMKRSIELAGVRDHFKGVHDVESCEEKEQRKKEKPCQCTCAAAMSDSTDDVEVKIKEPVTSPF